MDYNQFRLRQSGCFLGCKIQITIITSVPQGRTKDLRRRRTRILIGAFTLNFGWSKFANFEWPKKNLKIPNGIEWQKMYFNSRQCCCMISKDKIFNLLHYISIPSCRRPFNAGAAPSASCTARPCSCCACSLHNRILFINIKSGTLSFSISNNGVEFCWSLTYPNISFLLMLILSTPRLKVCKYKTRSSILKVRV